MAIKPSDVLGAAVGMVVVTAALAVLLMGAAIFIFLICLIGSVFVAPFVG